MSLNEYKNEVREILLKMGSLNGHNHATSINHESNKWYINTGSLGCPSDGINIARAGVIIVNEEIIAYEELNVHYDVKKVIEDIENIKYPDFKNILKYFYGIS
jgi:predicted phosphodiesterase